MDIVFVEFMDFTTNHNFITKGKSSALISQKHCSFFYSLIFPKKAFPLSNCLDSFGKFDENQENSVIMTERNSIFMTFSSMSPSKFPVDLRR